MFAVQVHAEDSDVTLNAVDGSVFKVHRANLDAQSDMLQLVTGRSAAGGVCFDLPEDPNVVELLLLFMYRRDPDLNALDFRTAARLVIAVDKYNVQSAAYVCQQFMGYCSFVCASCTHAR